ncbi:MAG: glycosyltransferase family 4 protein [Patescibacteria group bacterium]|nr:glycosyltransferase family 4 protein [Patescibacteria group bacterium]
MTRNPKKLVFVLPEYDTQTSTHYGYLVDLLEDVAEELDVMVFIEYGKSKPKFKNIQNYYVQKWQVKGLNLIERFFVFFWFRLKGYRRFYVHYSYFSAILAGIVCRLTGGKSFVWYCEQKNLYTGGVWPFKLAIRLIQNIVTCTDLMAGYYHEFFKIPKKKLKVMHNWVDVSEFAGARDDKRIVLFVHWLSPRKGSQYLPEIIEKTLAKTDCEFWIVGDGPDFEELKSLEETGKVKMLGAVPNNEILSFYKKASVFIMPSREEEFGRVLIEAMAAGVPIVTMETLGAKAVLNNSQKDFMVKQGDLDAFSDKIALLLDDNELQKKMREVGLDRAKHFDKKLSTKKFLEIVS